MKHNLKKIGNGLLSTLVTVFLLGTNANANEDEGSGKIDMHAGTSVVKSPSGVKNRIAWITMDSKSEYPEVGTDFTASNTYIEEVVERTGTTVDNVHTITSSITTYKLIIKTEVTEFIKTLLDPSGVKEKIYKISGTEPEELAGFSFRYSHATDEGPSPDHKISEENYIVVNLNDDDCDKDLSLMIPVKLNKDEEGIMQFMNGKIKKNNKGNIRIVAVANKNFCD